MSRPAHARDQRPLPSLFPSQAAATLERRRRQAPGAGAAQLRPAAHPEPTRARPGGGGPASGRSAALVRAPVTTRAGPGETRGRPSGRDPGPTHRPGGTRRPQHFLWVLGGWPGPNPSGASSTRSSSPPLTWLFPAPVPATPTGLGRSLRVARSLWRKYRESLAAKRNTAVKDLLFYHSVQNGKWKTPLRVRCWPIQRSSPPKAPPTAEDRPISLRLVRDGVRLNVERKEPSKNIKSLGRGKGCQIML